MRKSLRIASMVLASLLFFSYNSLKAQVKIGGNPAVVDPNALLELESNRKGFLLPRLNNDGFDAIIAANATVGMVVYYTGTNYDGAGLYVKQTTGTTITSWAKLAGADLADGTWKIAGNTGTNPATQFIGTLDNQPVVFRTDAVERFRISATGEFLLDNTGIPVDNAENQVLLLAADGTVKRKTLNLTMVESLSGKTGPVDLKILAGTGFEAEEVDLTVPGEITLNLPVMSGGVATQPYGFMRLEDWEKLNHLTTSGITVGTLVTDESQGASGAKITADGDGGYEIALGEATENVPGVVGTGVQSFAGDKTFTGLTTFSNNVAIDNGVGGDLLVRGKLNIGYPTLYNPVPAPASYNLLVQEGPAATEVKRFNLPSWKLDGGLASVNGVVGAVADGELTLLAGTTGTEPNIVPDALANTVTINIPNAAPANTAGLVTNADQEFAGNKLFGGNVTVSGGNVTVNSATAGNSNLSVNGSIGVKFRRLTTNGNIDVDDYMIFVKPTGSTDVTVTLPDPAGCSGRVYVIKREAKAFPIDELQEDFSVIVATMGGTGKFHGENTTPITVPNTTLNLMSDGTNWQIMSRGSGL
ncbi:hypothetical protein [Chitinophaga sp. XS-30]|uniref:hypothetical protein n=1 Tax=Chitinophaga sp. XS-30 TaxID=2604421 RepID=UPI0011DC7CE6|nr:hypothetical protein [Chitinophaga sp. XS-30]QEH40953.1 hypothetical protein FW415_08740 [Chitinophaga sp. XS-30]